VWAVSNSLRHSWAKFNRCYFGNLKIPRVEGK
jgi:hypothetical protein